MEYLLCSKTMPLQLSLLVHSRHQVLAGRHQKLPTLLARTQILALDQQLIAQSE